jgi:hypothetical protein
MNLFDSIISGIAHLLHPDKPREFFADWHFPSDLTVAEVKAALDKAAEGTPLKGWYERRSFVDLTKLTHPDNPDEAASWDNRAQTAVEAKVVSKVADYKGSPEQNIALWNFTLKALEQRGIPFPQPE